MSAKLTAQDILDQLDDDARHRAAYFPDFDHGYNYHVDARLSAYGEGAGRWVIVIEQVAVNPRSWGIAGVHTTLYYHGNAITLPPQPGWGDQPVQSLTLLENGPGGRFVDDSNEIVTPDARDLRIRGTVVPIPRDTNYYWARNIEVHSWSHERIDQMIRDARQHLSPEQADRVVQSYEELRAKVGKFELHSWHVMRALVPDHRELLLATKEERRRGVPADLPLLLQLDDWEHPRLLEGELPRSSDCFKGIARVLAAADLSLHQPPAGGGNVHWSNWPQSGSL